MSSGFISEAEINEQRKLRQEEWEKVRSADQPIDAPEQISYDSRCLFDRLQEQKNKRDAEYEEAHKLKNMIKGLDDDEVEFLDLVDRTKMEEERKKNLEEEKEMRDFKAAVASLQEKSLDERLKQELKQPQINHKTTLCKHSQLKLLAGVVKKPAKTENGSPPHGIKRKLSESEDNTAGKKSDNKSSKQVKQSSTENKTETKLDSTSETKNIETCVNNENSELQTGALKCIGILPGLGSYEDSSDSDCSSDSDEEPVCHKQKIDILGRPILPPKENDDAAH